MTYPTYHNLIGGQWLPAASGKTMLNLNPADHSDVIGAFPSSHAEDVALAVAAAKKAFATWRLVPAPKRAEILLRAGRYPRPKQRKVRPRDDPRDGQGAGRDARRRAGGHRRGLLRGWRGTASLRRHHPQRAARQVRHDPCACPSASSASSRRGTSPWPSPVGSSFPRWSPATPASSSRPPTRRSPPTTSSRRSSKPACRPESSISSAAPAPPQALRSSSIPTCAPSASPAPVR